MWVNKSKHVRVNIYMHGGMPLRSKKFVFYHLLSWKYLSAWVSHMSEAQLGFAAMSAPCRLMLKYTQFKHSGDLSLVKRTRKEMWGAFRRQKSKQETFCQGGSQRTKCVTLCTRETSCSHVDMGKLTKCTLEKNQAKTFNCCLLCMEGA